MTNGNIMVIKHIMVQKFIYHGICMHTFKNGSTDGNIGTLDMVLYFNITMIF